MGPGHILAGFDVFDLLLIAFILFVYGAILTISIIFTFSVTLYRKIEERLRMDLFPSFTFTPLEDEISWFDVWLTQNHRVVGPLFIILSLWELKSCLSIARFL